MRSETINVRVEPALKASAEKLFKSLGLRTSDAISLFLSRAVAYRGIPFDIRLPNKETQKAMSESRAGKQMKVYTSLDDLRRTIDGKSTRAARKA